jgi:hypothetical protein
MSRITLSGNASGTGNFTLASPNSNTDRTLTLPDATGTVNVSGLANEVPAGSAGAPAIYPTGDSNTGIFFPAADTIAFAEGGAEVARFDSSGNLLVGTTSSLGGKLSVQQTGAGNFPVQTMGTDRGISVDLTQSSGIALYFTTSSSVVAGQITVNGSATTYATSSDYRLKEDWQPMSGASERLMDLKPVNFAWKSDGSRVDGFLAHEAKAVVPEAVVGEKDQVQIIEIKDEDGNVTGTEEQPVYQGIDQSKLVPLLTAALQEALTEIASMKARITALEAN